LVGVARSRTTGPRMSIFHLKINPNIALTPSPLLVLSNIDFAWSMFLNITRLWPPPPS
jgi:hypothetical protein